MECVEKQQDTETDYRGIPPRVESKPGRPANLENMPLETTGDARQFLARMVQLVIKGKIGTKDAYCANAIINTMLRASESDLEERVKRIERDIETKADRQCGSP